VPVLPGVFLDPLIATVASFKLDEVNGFEISCLFKKVVKMRLDVKASFTEMSVGKTVSDKANFFAVYVGYF